MPPTLFEELVFDLKRAGMMGLKKPVVLLGAGASRDANIPLMRDLIAHFGCTTYEQFFDYVETLSPRRRLNRLAEFLQTQDPLVVTPGYRALAHLVAEGYFDLVLSTNMDPVLEDALAAVNLRRQDVQLLVNGIVRVDRLDPLLSTRPPRVKVVKLHGDVFTLFMAWTPAEMNAFLEDIGAQLEQLTYGHDLLVVGHSLADSPRIAQLARGIVDDGGTLWFVNPGPIPASFPASSSVKRLPEGFERFFTRLAGALNVQWQEVVGARRAAAPAAHHVQTVDDLMQSVFGLVPGGGAPVGTVFLLQQPRVFVGDRFVTDNLPRSAGELEVVDHRGRRYPTRIRRTARDHPFGPVLLDAPAGLPARGFQLGQTMRVPPVRGRVPHLVTMKCPVAPGASGAPVVDEAFTVRGFVVAGSTDLDNPWSVMYPASRWAAFAAGGAKAPRGRSSRRRAGGRRG
jgi:hypothetical protein